MAAPRLRHRLPLPVSLTLLAAIAPGLAPPAAAQSCWSYVNTPAATPISCVQQGDLSTACSWGEASACPTNASIGGHLREECHEDNNLSDCCTSVPAAGAQTVREMHAIWHQCFGAIGDVCDGNNPPQRGNRWYAFHRQIEADYNLWRQSFACNPMNGQYLGCKIESVDWCPNMQLRFGYVCNASAAGGCGSADAVTDNSPQDCNPANGMITPCRPDNATCSTCTAFVPCLFLGGAGPMGCQVNQNAACSAGPITLPHNELEDFADIEEVTNLLDLSFHGNMHGAVGASGPCNDINNSNCSVRDPMFWRLHKAIDDVVREWQNVRAADVMLVIDRSGSMNQQDSSGQSKLQVALQAADLFADLLEGAAPAGQANRVGIASYASSAGNASLNLIPPVTADATLRQPGQPFPTTLAAITAAGGGGCTSIGGGIEAALAAICPGGNCANVPDPPPAGTNRRKGLLLLTDGVENVAPCLRPAVGPPGPGCGNQCFGAALDATKLYDAQVCAVGFGTASSLNGDLLTTFAERQGGIYMQSPSQGPDGTWIDLKDFYAKCFGQLSNEFVGLDPSGVLAPDQPASETVEYTACGDSKLTFVAGWKKDVQPGDLRLLVTAPSGDLVSAADPAVDSSTQATWDFDRVRLPYRGSAAGAWRARLIRPHRTIVNGFASDVFADFEQGVLLVRDEIHRLCPTGCERTLYFEDETLGDSAYRKALAIEQDAGLLGEVEEIRDADELADRLGQEWDLLVYAHQGPVRPEPYDEVLAERLCAGLRAIITDTRGDLAAEILRCAGAVADGSRDHRALDPGDLAPGETIELIDVGHEVSSYGLEPVGSAVAARFVRDVAGVTVRSERGPEHRWFLDVLVRGLSRLEPHSPVARVLTGDDLLPTVRIAPMSVVNGGYDRVDARVEIVRPLVGIGTLIARAGLREPRTIGEEQIDPRAATLLALEEETEGPLIPTATSTHRLYDDGTHGDQTAGNAYWSAQLPGVARADGMYRYRFILDLEKDGCTTRREVTQSVFVEVGVVPEASGVQVVPDDGGGYTVTVTPRDRLGNLWGPGRPVVPRCARGCRCDAKGVRDLGDGRYALTVYAGDGSVCALDAFGARFQLPLDAKADASGCDRLREQIAASRLDSVLRLQLRAAADQACDRLRAARGDLAVAEAGAASALALLRHELVAHGPEVADDERAALERALEAVVEEHGLELPEPEKHHD